MAEVVCYAQPHSEDMLAGLISELDTNRWTVTVGEPGPETSILITGYASEEQLQSCPKVRALIIPFAGVPPRTRELMLNHPHIAVHNLHHNAPETAETALALLLAASKSVVTMDQSLRRNDWSPRYDPSQAIRLEGKTALILGYGAVGRRIARSCIALGMRVIVIRRHAPEPELEVRAMSDLHRSLAESDAIILALPSTPETNGLLGEAEFAAMKPGAVLVNIARANLVDEQCLFDALKSGRLRGAGLDVWYRYPESDAAKGYMGYIDISDSARNTPPANLPFHELPNVVMSPHRGGTSADVEAARVRALVEMLSQDEMPNRVNLAAGY
ncbi:MAG: NAD(P)-dependent oxidoreductase [Fimbriimonadaceae bacterium]